MSKTILVARVLLGLAFVVFGLNGFLHFFAPPPSANPEAAALGGALAGSYIFTLMSATELVAGVLLLAGRFVPLALLLLAPILVNIVGFHLALDRVGTGLGAFLLVLELVIAWGYRDAFKMMIDARPARRLQDAPAS